MVRVERLVIVLLGIVLLRAWWKLYKGKVKRWLKRTKDHLPRHWRPKSPDDCPLCQIEAQAAAPIDQSEPPVPYPVHRAHAVAKSNLTPRDLPARTKPVCTSVRWMPAAML